MPPHPGCSSLVHRPWHNGRGIDRARILSGTTQNDIIKEYLSRGTYIYPPKPVDEA
jgi:methylmalonyl-CoA mutase N-terminal domain/subunit